MAAGLISARRLWSQLRIPVAVLALLDASVCGTVLYDVLAVHLGE
ncbi:hypothetical protein [Streptomyces sp. NPDC050738]